MDGKKRLLIILAILWAGVIAYDLKLFVARKAPERKDANGHGLTLALLDRPRPQYKGVIKDIFSPVKTAAERPRVEKPAPPVMAAPPPPAPPSALRVFAAQAKFIGFVEKGADRKVFVSRGADIFILKKGDVIDGKIKVVDITDNLMTLTDESGAEQANIPLAVN
ncbi:MAG: hypothetical protein HY893_07955 [Deltaproteobacteria bacterium]|nr:hypothetical protein [Deltaproteobacteria bacterium]